MLPQEAGFVYLVGVGRRCGAALVCMLDSVRCRCVRLPGGLRLWIAVSVPLLDLMGGVRRCGAAFVCVLDSMRCRCVRLLGGLRLWAASLMPLLDLMGGIRRRGAALVCVLGVARLWSAVFECLSSAGWEFAKALVLDSGGMVVCSPLDLGS